MSEEHLDHIFAILQKDTKAELKRLRAEMSRLRNKNQELISEIARLKERIQLLRDAKWLRDGSMLVLTICGLLSSVLTRHYLLCNSIILFAVTIYLCAEWLSRNRQ